MNITGLIINSTVKWMNDVSIRQWAWTFFFVTISLTINSQQIGIGTGVPDGTAVVDITSTNKGILVPRMTTVQRLSIQMPAVGLLVFDITSSSFWYYDSQGWIEMINWALNGDDIFNPNSGNVGINQSSPAFPLDVNGSIRANRPGTTPLGSYISLSSIANDPGITIARGDGSGGVERRWDWIVEDDGSFSMYDNTVGQSRITADTTGSIGIGTVDPDPDATAVLQVNSTTKGFLPPRLTKLQRNSMSNLTEGLIVFCTDCSGGELQVFNGAFWTNIIGGFPASFGIGDVYNGGKVAYIYQPGDPGYVAGEIHGLIAAPDDLDPAPWGCLGVNIPSCEGAALGTGLHNSNQIIDWCAAPDIAAGNCLNLELNGYNDWFLPSKDELYKLYLSQAEIGGFQPFNYWGSTEDVEFPQFNASITNFGNGLQWVNSKDSELHVRAIRYF